MGADAKPCPFCGQVPDLDDPTTFQDNPGPKWGSLACCGQGPEVRTGYQDVSHWRDDALDAWNQRPIEDDLHNRIAELGAEVERLDDLESLITDRLPYGTDPEPDVCMSASECVDAAADELKDLRAEVERLRAVRDAAAEIVESGEHLSECRPAEHRCICGMGRLRETLNPGQEADTQ